jgi:hypothetical protein
METNNGKNTNTLLIIFGVVGIAIALFEVMINMHSVDESDRPIQQIQLQQIQAPQTSITSSSDAVQDTAVVQTNIRERHHAGRAARRRRASRTAAQTRRARRSRRSSTQASGSSAGSSAGSSTGPSAGSSAGSSNLTAVYDCRCQIDNDGNVTDCDCQI